MKLMKTTLSILSIALTAAMFAAGPILTEHQVFAYPNDLRGVAYGPCFQHTHGHLWSYTWCVKPGFKGGY